MGARNGRASRDGLTLRKFLGQGEQDAFRLPRRETLERLQASGESLARGASESRMGRALVELHHDPSLLTT